MLQRDGELGRLMKDLKKYSEFEGYSFYEHRMASYYESTGAWDEAIKYANMAVEKTPRNFGVLLTRAMIFASRGDEIALQRDIERIAEVVADDRTGEGKTGRFWLKALEIKHAVLRGSYHDAIRKLDGDFDMPQAVHQRLSGEVAWMINNDRQLHDNKLRDWANRHSR